MDRDPNKETAVILAELLQTQLGLPDGRVFLSNQKWIIPNDSTLFVEVAPTTPRPFAAGMTYEDGLSVDAAGQPVAVLFENQSVNVQEMVTVTIFSRDGSARKLATQAGLTFCFASTQAQQLQEFYAMQFSLLPQSMVDVSRTEGAARLNKFAYTLIVLRAYTRQFIAESFKSYANPPDSLIIDP